MYHSASAPCLAETDAVFARADFIQNRKDRAASQLKSSFLSFGLTIAIGLICMAGGFGVRIYNALSKSTGLGSYIGETMFLLLSVSDRDDNLGAPRFVLHFFLYSPALS